jgi:hypothetical protein
MRTLAAGLVMGWAITATGCGGSSSELPSTTDAGADSAGGEDAAGTNDVSSDVGTDTGPPPDDVSSTDTAEDAGGDPDVPTTDAVEEDAGSDVVVPPTTAQLVVQVLDRAAMPVAGATVSAGDMAATTDAQGHALLDIPAAGETTITISKAGYADTFRPMKPDGAPSVSFEATLFQPDVMTTVDVTDGATVALTSASADIGSLVIPKDGLVDAAGAKVTGAVDVAVVYVAPGEAGPSTSPAPMVAEENGVTVPLISHGMVDVTITQGDKKLDVAEGKSLELTLPAAPDAPTTAPLWYIDEDTGLWTQQGTATSDGDTWTAPLPHLSWWNVDTKCVVPPADQCCVDFQTRYPDGTPAPGVDIHLYPCPERSSYLLFTTSGAGSFVQNGLKCGEKRADNWAGKTLPGAAEKSTVLFDYTPTSKECTVHVVTVGCQTNSNCPSGQQCSGGKCEAGCPGGCPGGQYCTAGTCKTTCVPKCGVKKCGDDGCGGTCGSCDDGSGCTTDSCTAAGACVNLAQCSQGKVIWNDLSNFKASMLPTKAAPLSVPLAGIDVKFYRSNGWPIAPFTAPSKATSNSFTSSVIKNVTFAWDGQFKYININVPAKQKQNAGDATFDFGQSATAHKGAGWYYIFGVTALAHPGQGPLTLTSSLPLEAIGAFDAWGGKINAPYDPVAQTITGPTSGTNTQFQFFVLPKDASSITLSLADAGATADTFGFWVGIVNVGQSCSTVGGGTCTETSTCGDAIKSSTEVCDDGNTAADDGCSANCTAVEAGYACTEVGATTKCTKTVCVPSCTGKTCGSDGCSGTCGTCPGQLECLPAGICGCANDAECNVSDLWWNDIASLPAATTILTANDPASSINIKVPIKVGGLDEVRQITLTAKSNAKGESTARQFVMFPPPNTTNGSIFSEALNMVLGWKGNMPYIDVLGVGGAPLKGKLRFAFDKPASSIGDGYAYVMGVAGTAGGPTEGPTTITADIPIELASTSAWDAFNSGNKTVFSPPYTIYSDGGVGADGYMFYLIPPSADHIELDIDNTGGHDAHGYIFGVVRAATKVCAAGACTEKGVCGDGIKAAAEGCDDGNTKAGDGCGATCVVEANWACTVPVLTSVCTCTCPAGQICAAAGTCCAPTCAGKQCGDNGCGGVCGTCAVDETCSGTGSCDCVPQCTGRSCGTDGCAGTCGTCGAEQKCTAGQTCEACMPNCGGKNCGTDGCGGKCGTCAVGQTCGGAGTCVACVPACAGKTCGDDGCGGTCGACDVAQGCTPAGTCAATCVPSCVDKTCGDNGCGGTCGKCGAGQGCSVAGVCETCTPVCQAENCGDNGCLGSCKQCLVGEGCSVTGACVDACDFCGDGGCKAFGFEGGASLVGWSTEGDVSVVGSFGVTAAPEGTAMLRLSTGLSVPIDNRAERGMCADGATTLTFKWRFYSEEFTEYCGSTFNDAFLVKLRTAAGVQTLLARRVNDLCVEKGAQGTDTNPVGEHYVGLSLSEVHFDVPAGDVWVTPWQTATVTLPAGAESGTLVFEVNDEADTQLDTVVLIDEITLTP